MKNSHVVRIRASAALPSYRFSRRAGSHSPSLILSRLFACCAVWLLSLMDANSAVSYTAYVTPSSHGSSGIQLVGAEFLLTDSSPVSATGTVLGYRYIGGDLVQIVEDHYFLRTGVGQVGASREGSMSSPSGGGFYDTGSLSRADGEIVISGPGTVVDTSLNVSFDGTGICTGYAITSINLTLEVAGFYRFQFNAGLDPNGVSSTLSHPFVGLDAALAGNSLSVSGTGTTPMLRLPVDVPIPISFILGLGVSEGNTLGHSGTWDLDFANTASFALGGPVFNLPEGYTANGFGVVDNVYTVPEPSVGLLCALSGLVVLSSRKRIVS